VVVVVGLTVVESLPIVVEKVPGVRVMLVAPLVAQVSFEPMLATVFVVEAEKDVMVGLEVTAKLVTEARDAIRRNSRPRIQASGKRLRIPDAA
jgi:hypothetical protein